VGPRGKNQQKNGAIPEKEKKKETCTTTVNQGERNLWKQEERKKEWGGVRWARYKTMPSLPKGKTQGAAWEKRTWVGVLFPKKPPGSTR